MTRKIELNLYSNPHYRGKHIVVDGKKIYASSSSQKARKIFDRLAKEPRKKTLSVTYIPKEDTLILNLYA